LGCELVDEAMAHPLVHAFLRKVEEQEVLPHVHPVPDFTPAEYLELIDERFSNPAVKDTTRRLCLDGSNRQPKFIVPSILDGLKSGAPVTGLALESALWCRYCAGHFENGTEIAPNDPEWDRLVALSAEAKTRPVAWLEQRTVYGDLAANPQFAALFSDWLDRLWADGVQKTLEAYLAD